MARPTTRSTTEQALALDVGRLMRSGVIRPGEHLAGEMRFELDRDDLDVKFESRTWGSAGWLRLRYSIYDDWAGEEVEINDTIYLATKRQHFGGLRWWWTCPRSNRRVRKLYLPIGAKHFWSRHAYRLGYASQREDAHDRALRRLRKLHLRLGVDQADGEYPNKPRRMRWTT